MKTILFLLMLFLFSGCATTQQSTPTITAIPNLNEEKSAGIGDIFFEYISVPPIDAMAMMFGSSPQSKRFDLTVLELNEQKIGLQYSEYVYYSNPNTFSSGWAIKDGFNKRFDYAVADKVIRFKGYEFEIVSVEKGQIKYKRIK